MSLRSRRTVVVTALGAATALGLTLAPTSGATVAPPISTVAGSFAPQLVTVNTPTRADKDRLTGLGLDLTEHAGHDYVEVVLHNATDEARLRTAGFTWDVRIEDMLARQLERIALDEAYSASTAGSPLPSQRTGYRKLADFGAEIDALVAKQPNLAKRISIGKSVEGRDFTGIEIGRDVNAAEDGRPVFLMFGAHHAREWPSAELPMEFAHDLVNNYGTDPRITDLLNRGRAIIVPVSNPDGYDASRTSGDVVDLRPVDNGGLVTILGTPGNAYKRKNCRYVDGQTQPAGTCVVPPSPGGFGLGVDLNRNYGALWGGPGTESNPASPIYRGPAPFSEPETQAIRNLISTRQVTTLITNHTFSNLILRPVGVKPTTTAPDGHPIGFAPDECFTGADGTDKGMQALGERMAAQNGYSNQFGWELYDTTGTTEDYSYNATGGYGYTFEVGPNEFHPPYQQVVAEYTGDNAAAKAVAAKGENALTTKAADTCAGHDHDAETTGGGNRAAFLDAFENAVDAATHSVVTGQAPAGTQISLSRTGTFPLWDRSKVADTVETAMTVGPDGQFTYHANPSTRPFVASRKASILGDPKESLSKTGTVAPLGQTDTKFPVTQPADVLKATLKQSVGTGETVIRNMSLELLDPTGKLVAFSRAFAASNTLAWTGPDGTGVPAGEYTLRVKNTAGLVPDFKLDAATFDEAGNQTPGQVELWTLTCVTPAGRTESQQVRVDRGQAVDAGALCGAGETAAPTPTDPKVKGPKDGKGPKKGPKNG